MQYFTWGINKPGTNEKRTSLIKKHWDYIANYDKNLIARGPVMDPNDLGVVIGSIHIVELADFAEAEVFTYEEPFAKAGLFKSIFISQFELKLKRTQFDFISNPDFLRFFIYCPATMHSKEKTSELTGAHEAYCKKFDRHFICRGSLISGNSTWQGNIYFVEFANSIDVNNFLENNPFSKSGVYDKTETFRWTMGGPENLNAAGTLGK